MKNVTLTTSRFGRNESRTFDTLREALSTMRFEVEENLSAPVSLESPATVLGASTVRFTTHQIYLMLQLLDEVESVP
jgi:hypothetical protein